MTGEREGAPQVTRREGRLASGQQERRQREEPVAVGLAGGRGDGTAGSRRDIDQVVVDAGRGTLREIEADAQLVKQGQLPPRQQRRPDAGVVEVSEDEQGHLVEIGMGVALRQQAGECCKRREARERSRIVHGASRVAADQLDRHVAEMVGQAGLPRHVNVIAGL